jgi:predicted DNA-binding protein (UPF0251 family)
MSTVNAVPDEIQLQVARLSPDGRRQLGSLLADLLRDLSTARAIKGNPARLAEWNDVERRLRANSARLSQLVSVPVALQIALEEGPARDSAGYPLFRAEGEKVRVGTVTDAAQQQLTALCGAAASPVQRKRRRLAQPKTVRLTAKELEAWNLVSDHKGDFTAAARAAGVSRQALTKRYEKALAKLSVKAVKKPPLQSLPLDQRGQCDVDAQRKTRRQTDRE